MYNKKIIALALSAVFALTACDGDDGLDGQAGIDGVNGINGIDGKNGSPQLDIAIVGRFKTGDEEVLGKSAAEIVQFHQASQSAFAVNGDQNAIEVISLANLPNESIANPTSASTLSSQQFTFAAEVDVVVGNSNEKMTLGGANSIAIHGNVLAIAVAASTKQDKGAVLFYELDDAGQGSFMHAVAVGPLPDMVTFAPNGNYVLVANEGEPNSDYSNDPEGSISVIDIADGVIAKEASTINLTSDIVFSSDLLAATDYDTDDKRKGLLINAGLKLAGPAGTTLAQSLEPEYIAVAHDSKTAYVSFQENNAIGRIDIDNGTIEIKPLGYKHWGDFDIDYTNKDEIPSFRRLNNVYGMYQPDTIATYQWQGSSFIVSANEGDARDYDGYSEEVRVKDIIDPDELNLTLSDALQRLYDETGGSDGLGRLKVTTAMGDADNNGVYEALYAYGARSFSIWDQHGNLVFDSGDDFEKIAAAVLGNNFNSTHTENKGDNRSDDKGGEPEALAIGTIGDKTYSFIGLERSSEFFVYDVTSPFDARFVQYFNNRDYTVSYELDDDLSNPCDVTEGMDCANADLAGDLGPESIYFVEQQNSPNGEALLIVGNEVSGTVTVYQVTQK
ncbi:choice-of-anchor I family protein [Thalassotalea agarivorans]|uniref:Choice-of-anchor I domain-containing protein n=1 Tax=Thalassotalea agarivorans TaxID=349064 RepID=A0A1I0DBV6_THASX|nr:choice-of-anchor I family protein [Thalassotalea agarivorans]SET29613.1 hypothetical protein SAMN05660429_01449 [Thalassotalea agarivorans]